MGIEGKVTAVVGGGSGIGAGICEHFAAKGAKVAVCDVNAQKAQDVADRIVKAGGTAIAMCFDVRHRQEIEKSFLSIENELGELDVLVNSAGISIIVPCLECTEEIWDLTLDINLKGTFQCCQAALRHMAPRKRGSIINISSQSGKVGHTEYQAYCASKFGIIGVTQSLAAEFAPLGIRVNAICPGIVMTQMWKEQLPSYCKKHHFSAEEAVPYMEGNIPMHRLGTVEDVANVAEFLAWSESSYITGQSINVVGGYIMH
ncbi:MAG: SDR family oxidoreductase [Christensenellaceae bacterium]|jgi:NAD(P)-dependent dehydrogenase (short-subunit alcohol dehydrogenase family)|nr:SDR family oxidoreductase [Christensenellaceae bacterium]